MSPIGGSWITKPRWQIAVGIFVGLCILAAGLIPLFAIQSERDQRQENFAAASIQNDKEIEGSQIGLACAFIRGFEKAFKPGVLTGTEDEQTRNRIIKNNEQRSEALAVVRGEMPEAILVKINMTCPPETG